MMLISGQHAAEELRVALVESGRVEEYQVQVADAAQRRGNIYRGVVARVEPSLNAAFVDIGAERHGFLSIGDVVPQAYHRAPEKGRQPKIDEVLQRGRPLLVQVTRDAEGTKGPALNTGISVAGRCLVLTPYDATRGLSRKVEDEKLRRKIKQRTQGLPVPDGYGFIVRTNAVDQTKTELKRDLTALVRVAAQIFEGYGRGSGPQLLYDDQDLVLRALRDYVDSAVQEVFVDDERLSQRAAQYLQAVMPRTKLELKLYRGRVPLFSYFNLEPQIDELFQRTVSLPSGGSIVIDTAEALVAIDVNSGKSKTGASQGETALKTNLEAAAAVGRQLRLRDIGGLIVVDFIDMRASKDQRAVEKAMREAMRADRARVNVGRLSGNGLLEINRQRIHQAVSQRTHRVCPTCRGVGRVASSERAGLNLLRRIHARAATGTLSAVTVHVHAELADAINNQRRAQIATLERDLRVRIEVRGDPRLGIAEERIEWVKRPQGEGIDGQPPAGRRDAQEPIVAAAVVLAAVAADDPEPEADPAPAASAPPEAEHELAEPAPAASNGTRRRRRRGRRGKREGADGGPPAAGPADGGEAPAEMEAAEGDAEGALAKAEQQASNGETRRKRSRGGRGRGRARRQEQPAAEASDAAADPASGSADEGEGGAQPAAAAGTRRSRRGRRRRRGGRGAEGNGEGSAEGSVADDSE